MILGLIFIIFGILNLNPSTAKAMIRFSNKMKGVKTEISSTTMAIQTISGIVLILLGISFFISFK